MSRVKTYTLTGTAGSTTAFAAGQNTTANTPLTLASGATDATLAATPREVTLTSAADFSAVTFVVVGKDRSGNPITESIVGPGAGLTVQGRKVYSYITSITPSATVGSNVSAGYPQRIVTPWVILDAIPAGHEVPIGQIATEVVSGTPDASVENTYENFTQVSGEGAYVQSSTDTTPPAVSSLQGVGIRGVVTSSSGTIKFRFVRPSF